MYLMCPPHQDTDVNEPVFPIGQDALLAQLKKFTFSIDGGVFDEKVVKLNTRCLRHTYGSELEARGCQNNELKVGRVSILLEGYVWP